MANYQNLREAITKLIDHPLEDWSVTRISAENCLEHLDKYESEGRTPPKMFIEDRGVTLVWIEEELRTYHHFYADEKEDDIDIFRTRT